MHNFFLTQLLQWTVCELYIFCEDNIGVHVFFVDFS